jgi:hypothetical protein
VPKWSGLIDQESLSKCQTHKNQTSLNKITTGEGIILNNEHVIMITLLKQNIVSKNESRDVNKQKHLA